MEDEEFTNVSDWNEQMYFSRLFFQITAYCRQAQIERNLSRWRQCIESKMSLLMGISSPEEKEKFTKVRKKIDVALSYYNFAKGKDDEHKATNELISMLITSEGNIDTVANSRMPFLKQKEEYDIGDL